MKLAWLTDIHLNFVDEEIRNRLWASVGDHADAVAITGDIGESHDVRRYLEEAGQLLQIPIYFVLGNHDFYGSSIDRTRSVMGRAARSSERLVYLSQAGVVELTPRTAIIGHDGWADTRLGSFATSGLVLNDYLLVRELAGTRNRSELRRVLQALGDEAAQYLRTTLEEAVRHYPRVIVATHVPPFREATWHEGRLSDDNWLPHFSCEASGRALRSVMAAHPECEALVLCGHTHGGGEARILDNLRVITGGAEYGRPEIQRILDVG